MTQRSTTPSFAALLDACVLIPAPLCDTLLRAAEKGLYRVHWSDEILSEVERNLILQRGISPEKAARRVRLMREAFEEALVEGYEELIPSMKNHEKDRHVLAAAVVSGSQVIVTANLKDFPKESLDQYLIEAQSPDEFLTNLFDLYQDVMAQIVIEQVSSLRNPRTTSSDVVDAITRDAPQFAGLMQRLLGLR